MARAKAKEATARRLPAFRNDEEERRFWETHSFADYFSQTRPVRVQVSRRFAKRVKARKPK
jgi:hypothetical protein